MVALPLLIWTFKKNLLRIRAGTELQTRNLPARLTDDVVTIPTRMVMLPPSTMTTQTSGALPVTFQRKGKVHLMMHSTHFIYGYKESGIW